MAFSTPAINTNPLKKQLKYRSGKKKEFYFIDLNGKNRSTGFSESFSRLSSELQFLGFFLFFEIVMLKMDFSSPQFFIRLLCPNSYTADRHNLKVKTRASKYYEIGMNQSRLHYVFERQILKKMIMNVNRTTKSKPMRIKYQSFVKAHEINFERFLSYFKIQYKREGGKC